MRRLHAFLILTALVLCASPSAASPDHDHGHGSGNEEHHDEGPSTTVIPESSLERLGLRLHAAEPQTIVAGLQVSGRIVPLDEKLAHVSPRFAGVVKDVRAKVGDRVGPDSLLATIESNENLQTFHLRPAISGIVIKRHATLGESVSNESVLFIVADLSEVWAEFAVYKQDVDKVKVGTRVRVFIAQHLAPEEGDVVFVSPVTDERTQSRIARVLLKNPDPHFSPGAFVSGLMVQEKTSVVLAVRIDAIQQLDGQSVVFVRDGENFEPRPVVTGASDETYVEIVKGLAAGDRYAAGNTFLLKADAGKSEAEHEH